MGNGTNKKVRNHKDNKEWYVELFQHYENSLNGQKKYAIYELHKAAIKRLKSLDFPNRKLEDWKYTSVANLLQHQYLETVQPYPLSKNDLNKFDFHGLDAYKLVYINGVFNKELSSLNGLPEGVIITDLNTALSDDNHKDIAHSYYHRWASTEKNFFVVLNAALAKHGTFIYVPENVIVEKPIHFLCLGKTKEQPIINNHQRIIVARENSQLTFLESYHTLNGKSNVYFTNVINEIIVGKNAMVDHLKVQDEDENVFFIHNTRAHQEQDSTYTSFAIDTGSELARNDIDASLNENGIQTNLYGIFLVHGNQHIDNHTFVDHASPHCNSNELYKGVIDQRGKGVFNGKIIVREKAQKTNAFQQNNNLVLSKTASMNTKPQLEIFADDVKCSHGATVGQLEDAAVYYLRSRGLSHEESLVMLKQAFLREVTDLIKIEPIRKTIEELVIKKFSKTEKLITGSYTESK